MRYAFMFYVFFSHNFTQAQYIYFDSFWPNQDWLQTTGGNIQIELVGGSYKVSCSPNLGEGYGFGLINLDELGVSVSSTFYETGGSSGNALSDGYIVLEDGDHLYCGDREDNQWVVKFDGNDSIEWEFLFPYNFVSDEIFSTILVTSGGFLFPGHVSLEDGASSNSLFIFKTSLEGDSLYFNYFDPDLIDFGQLDSSVLLSDGSILLSLADRMADNRALVKVQPDGFFEEEPQNYFFYNQGAVLQNAGQLINNDSGNVVSVYTTGDEDTWNGMGQVLTFSFQF